MGKKVNQEFTRKNGCKVPCYKSKYCTNASPIWVSDDMSGKMDGIPSVSTSCLVNPYCLARMKNGEMVCAHCFAETQQERYSASREHSIANYELLNGEILPKELLPKFGNVQKVRIESFGDLGSITQAINYLHMVEVNPHVTFAWWTKNHNFVIKAIERVGKKPKNLVLVASSVKLNEAAKLPAYFDKVFTVYDKKTIARDKIDINCGARSCVTCGRCYSKRTAADVREQLK